MTEWRDMTIVKRRWMVFRAVVKLQPQASVEAIQFAMKREHAVDLRRDYIDRTLRLLEDRNRLTHEHAIVEGEFVTLWTPIPQNAEAQPVP